MKKLALLLALLALAAVRLRRLRRRRRGRAPRRDHRRTTETTEAAGGGGGGGTVAISADPDGALAFTETALTAPAGAITVEFDNPASLGHDVVIEDADGNELARTDVITGDSTTRRRPSSRPASTPSTARSPATARPAWRARSPSSRRQPSAATRSVPGSVLDAGAASRAPLAICPAAAARALAQPAAPERRNGGRRAAA